jgi:tricorn protease
MGPVIGTRTWGGLVGVSMSFELMDGSEVTAPDYRIYTTDGEWTVENEGVTPDIIVELDPAEMARGWDAQLQKGIEVLLEAIEREPRELPQHPPFPVLVEGPSLSRTPFDGGARRRAYPSSQSDSS